MPGPLNIRDFSDTITGHDEAAVEERFGYPLEADELDDVKSMRALYFLSKRHEGMTDDEAWSTTMDATRATVQATFTMEEEPGDVFPNEPVTSAGKDGSSSD